MKKNNLGFTLVELVVVIIILWILSTVGFVAYTDYLKWARDSNRIQQVTGIFDAIQLFSTRADIPLPREITQIRYGTNLIWYQGDIDLSVLERIEYSEWGKDPKTLDFYSYMISSDRKSAQILTYFEDQKSIRSQQRGAARIFTWDSYAVFDEDLNYADLFITDYTLLHPFVYWFELWIMIEEESKAPINKNILVSGTTLDLFTSTWSFDSYISNSEILSGSWDDFVWIIPRTDCAKLQDFLWWIPSDIYKINPSGVKPINTYCDMDIDGGWWTLIWRTHPFATEWFWWTSEYGNALNNDDAYSMWDDTADIRFNEILFTTYTSNKNIDSAIKLTVDNYFSINISAADTSSVSNITDCEMVLTGSLVNPCLPENTWNQSAFTQWWKFALENSFWTWFDDTSSGALISTWYVGWTQLWSGVWNSFDGKQGMIFVR